MIRQRCRHLVWLVAIVALLVVPVFSAMLPQWQVLPGWAAISHESAAVASMSPTVGILEQSHVQIPWQVSPVERELPSTTGDPPLAEASIAQPAIAATVVTAGRTAPNWDWVNALPLFWAIGFCLLMMRLMAARLMLWRAQRRGTVIGRSRLPNDGRTADEDGSDGAIVAAFEAARRQLGVRPHVHLLIHSERKIPAVWGVVRFRLLLPEVARQWSAEQLRSVLLHELAHIQRRDTVVQLLAQLGMCSALVQSTHLVRRLASACGT